MTNEENFREGDVVLVNGTQVATVKVYDTLSGQLVLEQNVGGGLNTIYGPIVAYRLEHLAQPALGTDVRPGDEAPEVVESDESDDDESDEGPKDQFTTAGSL